MGSLNIILMARNICPRLCRSFSQSGIYRNYWSRRDGFSELSTALRSVENCAKDIDREMNRIFGDFQRSSPIKIPRFFSPIDCGRVREIPVVSTDGSNRLYKLELDMQDMKPENINITLKNNELIVTAKRDEKREDGSRFVRENTYHYSLPENINTDTIRSSLTNGVLTIEASLPAIESKEIPVNREDGDKMSSDGDKVMK